MSIFTAIGEFLYSIPRMIVAAWRGLVGLYLGIHRFVADSGWQMTLVFSLIASTVVWFGVEGVVMLTHEWEYYGDGTIINMTYEPSKTTTTFVPDGNGGTRMQTNYISEKYILLIRVMYDTEAVQVTSKQFAATKEGAKVGVYRRYGILLHAQRIGGLK